MPDTPPAPKHDPARVRFIALGLYRLSGALIAVFGMLIYAERFDFVAEGKAHELGLIVIVVGLFQFLIVPRILASAWRTPRSEDPPPP